MKLRISKYFEWSFFIVIARLERAIQRNGMDHPVEPDNGKYLNQGYYE
jgi:hypothetical protein